MEAKDTVMHLDDIDDGRMPDSYASQHKALEKQAEISFKAGIREVMDKLDIDCLICTLLMAMDKAKHKRIIDKYKKQRDNLLKLKEVGD